MRLVERARSQWQLLVAFVLRLVWQHRGQWFGFAAQIVSIGFGVVSQFGLGRFVDAAWNPALGEYGGRFLGYSFIGLALVDLQTTLVTVFPREIKQSQQAGLWEILLVSAHSPLAILTAAVLPAMILGVLRFALYGVVGSCFFGLAFGEGRWLTAILIAIVACVSFIGLGLLAAGLSLRWRRTDPVQWLVFSSALLAGGLFYPISILPARLRVASAWLPLPAAAEALRTVLLPAQIGRTLTPVLVHLSGLALALLGLGVVVLHRAVQNARLDGTFYSLEA